MTSALTGCKITFDSIIQCTGSRTRGGHGERRLPSSRSPIIRTAHADVVALSFVGSSKSVLREGGERGGLRRREEGCE